MAKTNTFKLDELVQKLIACLDEGKIPWEKYWSITKSHVSRATGKQYSWLNCLFLEDCGEYITPKQAINAGINIKGMKCKVAYGAFPRMITVKDKDGNESQQCIGRAVKSFNLLNCKDLGLEPKYYGKDNVHKTVSPDERNEEIERAVASYLKRSGVSLTEEEGENKAYYSPIFDGVHIKRRDFFKNLNAFYGVLFHELVHSTGHKKRLNRFNQFEHHDYDREELVAEIGSAILRNHFGIEHSDMERNTQAYIQSWSKALNDKKDMIVWAAGRAERAVKMILGLDESESESEVEE